jgi:lysozyme family protein
MLRSAIEEIIEGIVDREGDKFTNHAADPGGPTKFGITQETLSRYLKRPASVDDVRNLTLETASQVYEWMFILEPGFHKVEFENVQLHLIDFGVHSGPETAVKHLQRILGVKVDGVLGPQTLKALHARKPREIAGALWDSRLAYMGQLVRDDVRKKTGRKDTHAENIFGWINRMQSINPWR